MKNQKGITLIALVLTIIVLMILTFTIAVNFTPYQTEKTRTDFTADMTALEEEIEQYYVQNKSLPVLNKYTYTSMINGVKNVNDNDTYYVIDLDKISATLNYGADFEKVLRKDPSASITQADEILDIYIVNEKSHTVYYPKGAEYSNKIHYRLEEEYTQVQGKETVYIHNKGQLEEFRNKVNSGEKTFENINVVLVEDIDLNGNPEDNTTWWTPIGTNENRFKGTFDGNNHKIDNMYINTANGNQGFFGVSQGTIKNLIINTGYVKGSSSVGGIAGQVFYADIINCRNSANVESTDMCIGGIVGTITTNSNGVKIENCSNYGEIETTGYKLAGGIAGYINTTNGKAEVKKCYNYGKITQTSEEKNPTQVGGIVGYSGATTIYEKCGNEGEITAAGNTAGISCSTADRVEDCYNVANIESGKFGVGIVYSATTILNCYNAGDILANTKGLTEAVSASGISYGCNGTIKKCYNTGNITGRQNVAGIIVTSSNTNLISNCYNTGNINATTWTVGGIVAWEGGSENSIDIENCYNTGTVQTAGGNCGGIVGGINGSASKDVTIKNCYNVGEIIASSNARESAILGSYSESQLVTRKLENCYYLDGTGSSGVYTQQDEIGKVENVSEVNMKTSNFVTKLGTKYKTDENDVNSGYPILAWQ